MRNVINYSLLLVMICVGLYAGTSSKTEILSPPIQTVYLEKPGKIGLPTNITIDLQSDKTTVCTDSSKIVNVNVTTPIRYKLKVVNKLKTIKTTEIKYIPTTYLSSLPSPVPPIKMLATTNYVGHIDMY